MLFISIDFIIFFLIIISILRVLKENRYKKLTLILAGCYFYAYWDYRFLFLLIFSALINYVLGKKIYVSHERNQKIYLSIGIIINLVVLGIFKYLNFFINSADNILKVFGFELQTINIILPLGISFFTFEIISYLIDIYRHRIKENIRFVDFLLFMFFFPRLISGPIIRTTDFLPQANREITISKKNLYMGMKLFFIGVVKKLLIADRLAYFIDSVFQSPSLYNTVTIWLAVIGYSLQIFCDFSGYSDMAIGIAKCIGFDLPENFKMPYISMSISEFWKRWHISLSSWLKDYLYISLGGNRKGKVRTYVNLILTMLLGGLWHGASWNFVVWGGLHGGALCVNKYYTCKTKNMNYKECYIYKFACWLFAYLFVSLCWIFFRSNSFYVSFEILHKLLGFSNVGISWYYTPLIILIPIIICIHVVGILLDNKLTALPMESIISIFLLVFMIIGIVVLMPQNVSPFVYFQF